jgi:hypothetical protein
MVVHRTVGLVVATVGMIRIVRGVVRYSLGGSMALQAPIFFQKKLN